MGGIGNGNERRHRLPQLIARRKIHIHERLRSERDRARQHRGSQNPGIVDVREVPQSTPSWTGLAADDSPLLRRDKCAQETYVLNFELP